MTHETYAEIPAMNFSALKNMDVSPHYFRWRAANPRPDTAALFFGRAFHCALLEPDRFPDTYAVEPDFGDCRFKANKEARDNWRADHATHTPLSAEDGERIVHMVRAVRAHRHASHAIRGACEETVTWQDAVTGLACKCRLDTLRPSGVADLKTTRDPGPRAFGRDAGRYLYHGQLAWYHDGIVAAGRLVDPELPLIIAIQSEGPWDVAVYRMDADALESGRALYRRLLQRFAECTAANWWPGVAPEIMPLQLPAYLAETTPEPTEDF